YSITRRQKRQKLSVWDDGSEDVNPFGEGNSGFHDDQYDNPLLTKKTESKPIIWDIGDEEEEYPFVNKYMNFQEEPIMSVEEESCLVYDTYNKEEESMPVYDTDVEEVIEEEDGDEKEVVYDDYEEASVFDDDQYKEEIVSEDLGRGFGEEEDTSEDTELREHHTDDKDCDGTHTRQILDHSVAELFHQDLHGQMLCICEKVNERLRNSEDDVRKRIAPMDNKLGLKTIKVRGRVLIKKGNLMQGTQICMIRVQGTSETNSRTSFFK
nr:paired amphipathic helix protein Sin3-like 3 isoform X1 [Tanacetum cinerariifolium]